LPCLPPTRKSCPGTRKVCAPAIRRSGARSRATTRAAETWRWLSGFSVTNRKAELVERPPVKPETESTAGSCWITASAAAIRAFIAAKEVDWSACMVPIKRPVSCSGKNPFGTTANSRMFNRMVSTNPAPTSRAWRNAQRSELS